MELHYLTDKHIFPSPDDALTEPNGLLAVGGDLDPSRLSVAYYNGIFPWFTPGQPILWWSPDPRAVIYPKQLHVSRSMKKFIRKSNYTITLNHCFAEVILQCGLCRPDETWITPQMRMAYTQLHQQGIAHSVEVWQDEQLVGGLYGIGQGLTFSGESMFSYQSNVSKLALVALCQHLLNYGFQLIDSQVLNDHTASLGAIEMGRTEYLSILHKYRSIQPPEQCWHKQQLVINE